MTSVSWVDLLMVGIIAGSLFSGDKKDFIAEIFYVFGLLLGTAVACHYYLRFLSFFTPLKDSAKLMHAVSFFSLALLVFCIFAFLRVGWKSMVKIEGWVESATTPIVYGLVALRSVLICGLVLLGMMMVGNSFLMDGATKSGSRPFLKKIVPAIYRFSYENGYGKIFTKEPVSQDIFLLMDEPLPGKEKTTL
jgi:uncharacterized membrane protein required for colicin V production